MIDDIVQDLWRNTTKPEFCEHVGLLFASKFFDLVDVRVADAATPTAKTRCILEITDRLLRLAAAVRANDDDAISILEHEHCSLQ